MNVKGKFKKGVPTVLGFSTLRALNSSELSAGKNQKRFLSKPKLSKESSKNIRAIFDSLKKDESGNIIEYTFKIIYTSTGKGAKPKVKLRWNYRTEEIVQDKIKNINKLKYGLDRINSRGERRKIIIQGDVGANFGLAINESFVEDIVENGEIIDSFVNKSEDISIIKKPSNKTLEIYGKEVGVIQGVIPKSGRVVVSQEFPSCVVKKAQLTHAISSSAVLKIADTTGLKIGDRLLTSSSAINNDTTLVKINSIDSETQVTLDTTIGTLAIGSGVAFCRNRNFSIDLIPGLTPNIDSKVETQKTIRQYQDPILTITNSIAAGLQINSGGSGVDYVVKKLGKANYNPRQDRIKIKLTCTGKTFNSLNVPKLKPYKQAESWFTNTDANANGGTQLQLVNFTYTGLTTSTVVINYEIRVVRWGNKDLNITLDLSNAADATKRVLP